MSDLPEQMSDQYGFTPTQISDSQRPQQGYYPDNQSMLPYPSQPQQQQQASMNPSRARQAALNMSALAAALPDLNYSQSQAQSQAYAQLSAQQQQRYQTPPAAALAYQLQQQQQQFAPTPLRTQQQPNQQYAPQFAQQFQGMYVPAPGAHMQTLPSGKGMPQQGYAGVFARQQQQVPPFFYHQQAPLFAGQAAMFPGQFAPQHGGGSGQSSRRLSEQLSVGGSDVGRGSRAGSSSSIRGPPRKPAQSAHALWVGNLPPAVSVLDMKEHFAQGAREDILSVFLIAKSSCAFVNYRTEEACASAVGRFHDSRLRGVRVVCSLRRSAVGVAGGVPTGPAALSGGKIEGEKGKGRKGDEGKGEGGKVDGEEGENSATTPEEKTPAKRYFIVKSLTIEDLEMSVRNGLWATQSHNEAALDKAYKTAETVYLIFSANKSGEYYGYARMTSPINQDPAAAIAFAPAPITSTNTASATTFDFASVPGTGAALTDQDQPTATITPASTTAPRGRIIDDSARGSIFWEAYPVAGAADEDSGGGSGSGANSDGNSSGNSGGNSSENFPFPLRASAAGAAWGKPFSVEWESTRRVPFFRSRGLKNAWNAEREVKIARDGMEIETRVGRRLIGLFGGLEGGGGGDGVGR